MNLKIYRPLSMFQAVRDRAPRSTGSQGNLCIFPIRDQFGIDVDSLEDTPAQPDSQVSSSTTVIEIEPQPPISDLGEIDSQIEIAPEIDNIVDENRSEDVDHVSLCVIDKPVKALPSDPISVYGRQMNRLTNLGATDYQLCKQILSVASLARRPVNLEELAELADLPTTTKKETTRLINECSSFLAIGKGSTVHFVHQSAKDYLQSDGLAEIFPDGLKSHDHALYSRSLQGIAVTLRRDIYDLKEPGCLIENVEDKEHDPLGPVRYACIYWVDHLCADPREADFEEDGILDKFLQKDYLHWIEALSLLRSMSAGVFWMLKLEKLVTVSLTHVIEGSSLQLSGMGSIGFTDRSYARRISIYTAPQAYDREQSITGLCLCPSFQSDSKHYAQPVHQRRAQLDQNKANNGG